MNYCTKCGSLYEQPGTCNCFAAPVTVTVVTTSPRTKEVVGEMLYQLHRNGVLKQAGGVAS